jgi:4-amino-4-deoxy-L-arabinose transferase-like glycosyltransferase
LALPTRDSAPAAQPGLHGLRGLGPTVAVRLFVAWAGVLLVLQLLGLGSTPLFDVDEGAFSAATRELLASGDWGHTTLNGEPRFDKPILIYWLQATSVALFGLDEFALRLPSALASWGWAVAVGAFAMARWGVRAGVCAGTVLATSLGVTLIGRAATADALLNLWLALAALDLWRAVDPQARTGASGGPRAAWRRAAVWIGLGLLTKGPVALLVPGAALGLWLAVEGWRAGDNVSSASTDRLALVGRVLRRGLFAIGHAARRLRPLLSDPVAWALLLAVAVPWYAYALQRHGMAFVDGFLWRHNLQRYGGTLEGHGGAWFYYLALLPVLLFPWSALLPTLWPSLRGRAAWAEPLGRYLLLWAGFVLVFFSGSGTKLPHYLLYGLTPLALLLGRALARMDRQRGPADRPATSRRVLAAGLVALPLIGMALIESVRALARHDALGAGAAMQSAQLAAGASTWLLWLSAGGTALLIASLWNPITLAAGVWRPLLAAALGLLFTVEGVLPWWGDRLQGPVRDLAHAARRWQIVDALPAASGGGTAASSRMPTVVQWGLHQPSFSVYLGDVSPRRAPQPGELALVRSDRLADLADPSAGWTVIDRAPGLALIRRIGRADGAAPTARGVERP